MPRKSQENRVTQFLSELYQELKDIDPQGKVYKGTEEEVELLRSFFALHDEKVTKIRAFVADWEAGKTGTLHKHNIEQEVLEVNRQLKPVILRLLDTDRRNELILDFLLTHRGATIRSPRKKAMLESVKGYYQKIEEDLRFLHLNMYHQNRYLMKFRDDFGGRFVQDIENHGAFYMMLNTEIQTDQQIRILFGHIIEMVEEEFKRESEEKFRISHLQFFEELLDPSSTSFYDYYYKLYSISFPKSELDSKTWVSEYAQIKYQINHIMRNNSRTHLLVLKQGEAIIGGGSFEFLPVNFGLVQRVLREKNPFAEVLSQNTAVRKVFTVPAGTRIGFGVQWYTICHPDYRGRGIGTRIDNEATMILSREAAAMGYIFRGKLGEQNSPKLMLEMDPALIKEDLECSMNPNVRLRFFAKRKRYTFDCRYVQPAFEGCERCEYLMLRAQVLDNSEWKKSLKVPIWEFVPLIYSFMRYGIGLEKPEYNKDFLDIIKSIKDKKNVRLMEIDDYIDDKVIEKMVQELLSEGKLDEKRAALLLGKKAS